MYIKMILTNGFDPDPRVYKEAKVLVDEGHDVEILCWDRESKYLESEIEVSGIKVKRFHSYSRYGGGLKQLKSYISFIKQVQAYLNEKKIDIIHAHDLDGAIVGAILKRNSMKLIWDMHEFYNGFNYSLIRKMMNQIAASYCFKKADGFLFVVDEQNEKYAKFIKHKPVITIPNTAEFQLLGNIEKTQSQKTRIAFIGAVRDFERLKLLMDVGEKFENIIIMIHGAGTALDQIMQIKDSYSNTIVTGRFSYDQIPDLYKNTDVIYAVYDVTQENVRNAFPVKVYEAIVSGTPVIVSKDTLIGKFVEDYNIGYSINCNSHTELINVLKEIQDRNKFETKIEAVDKLKQIYTWEKTKLSLIDYYQKFII
ncbi:glycosyltransferase [Paenibacillus sp. JMULE4]|uniref:glycosyltransferase n=1 Tax=Paenibacillus sp. JMULE4 TaxID=2518342 RepID=UPI0015757AFD|nr:glycosyltransferase [Paenibacillus sp. JMULE4]